MAFICGLILIGLSVPWFFAAIDYAFVCKLTAPGDPLEGCEIRLDDDLFKGLAGASVAFTLLAVVLLVAGYFAKNKFFYYVYMCFGVSCTHNWEGRGIWNFAPF